MKTGNFQIFAQIIEYIIKYFKWVVIFAAVLIVLSGIYRVQSNEVAIVLRFGRLVGNTLAEQVREPGLHFALPFFIDEVIKIPVQVMRERDISTHYRVWRGRILPDVEQNGYLLTGDTNIVLIRARVLYQINNPVHYALFSANTGEVIDGVVSGELTRQVTQMDIDTVLTGGRAELSATVMRNSQRILDELKTGVAIVAVELPGIVPPMEVVHYFEEVRSAAVNKETEIQHAREIASGLLLSAQAGASAYKQSAISAQHEMLTRVHSEMAEFNGLVDLFAINPQLIMAGSFRERVSAVITQSGGAVIIPQGSDLPFILFPR